MPENKNAMTRYALIDKLLASRTRAYSIQDITDILAESLPDYGQRPVSKRCVEKDLNYLMYDSPFDVEIEEYWVDAADKNDRPYRKRCLRYADPTFSIFKPKLTEDEKNVLSAALDTLGGFEGLDNFEWLNDLKSRLDLEEHEPIISISKNILTNSTLLARLFTVIKLKQAIILHYHTFSATESRNVSVSPHMLREFNNRWYLIASASDTGRILTFALDRIEYFDIDYKTKCVSSPPDLLERFEDMVGVTYNDKSPLMEIVFWVSDNSRGYVSTKPIHGSQRTVKGEFENKLRTLYPYLQGGQFFRIECKENYELIRELTSFGQDLVVISPKKLKDKVVSRIDAMYNIYHTYQTPMN